MWPLCCSPCPRRTLDRHNSNVAPSCRLVPESHRYPRDAPLVLVTNDTLPPGLARRLIEAANTRAAAMAGADPIVHGLVGWLQGASKACHRAFLEEVREREERAAAEKKEVRVEGLWVCRGIMVGETRGTREMTESS